MTDLLQLCETFIRTDSRNKSGNKSLALLVANELKQLGFKVTFQYAKLAGAQQVNLVAQYGKDTNGALLINTHLDTVDTHAPSWSRTNGNPFNPVLQRGRLYGLGAADTKLALACQLVALRQLDLTQLKRPLVITGTYGEEMGLVGVQKLIQMRQLRPAFALNSEPTQLKLSNGNFGFRIYDLAAFKLKSTQLDGYYHTIQFTGKAAHSAVRAHGHNAIEHALMWLSAEAKEVVAVKCAGGLAPNIMAPECTLEVMSSHKKLQALHAYKGRVLETEYKSGVRVFPQLSAVLQGLPTALLGTDRARETSNFGLIQYNSGQFAGSISHRFAPGINPDEELEQWRRQMRLLAVNGVHVSLSVLKDNLPFKQEARVPFVRAVQSVLKRMNKDSSLFLKPGCTEAMYFAKLGCDVLTIGPGESYGNIHAPNESIKVKDLKEAVSFYRQLIQKLCL